VAWGSGRGLFIRNQDHGGMERVEIPNEDACEAAAASSEMAMLGRVMNDSGVLFAVGRF